MKTDKYPKVFRKHLKSWPASKIQFLKTDLEPNWKVTSLQSMYCIFTIFSHIKWIVSIRISYGFNTIQANALFYTPDNTRRTMDFCAISYENEIVKYI